jgi:hypothetical protein
MAKCKAFIAGNGYSLVKINNAVVDHLNPPVGDFSGK